MSLGIENNKPILSFFEFIKLSVFFVEVNKVLIFRIVSLFSYNRLCL